MQTKVQNWGNSVALRIPKSFAKEARITSGSVVDLSLEKGKIIISPSPSVEYNLKDLLKKMNKKNLHGEVDTGKSVGKEAW